MHGLRVPSLLRRSAASIGLPIRGGSRCLLGSGGSGWQCHDGRGAGAIPAHRHSTGDVGVHLNEGGNVTLQSETATPRSPWRRMPIVHLNEGGNVTLQALPIRGWPVYRHTDSGMNAARARPTCRTMQRCGGKGRHRSGRSGVQKGACAKGSLLGCRGAAVAHPGPGVGWGILLRHRAARCANNYPTRRTIVFAVRSPTGLLAITRTPRYTRRSGHNRAAEVPGLRK